MYASFHIASDLNMYLLFDFQGSVLYNDVIRKIYCCMFSSKRQLVLHRSFFRPYLIFGFYRPNLDFQKISALKKFSAGFRQTNHCIQRKKTARHKLEFMLAQPETISSYESRLAP